MFLAENSWASHLIQSANLHVEDKKDPEEKRKKTKRLIPSKGKSRTTITTTRTRRTKTTTTTRTSRTTTTTTTTTTRRKKIYWRTLHVVRIAIAWEKSRHLVTPSLACPAKWRLRNDCRNSKLMTCHCPYLSCASDWSWREGNLLSPNRNTT